MKKNAKPTKETVVNTTLKTENGLKKSEWNGIGDRKPSHRALYQDIKDNYSNYPPAYFAEKYNRKIGTIHCIACELKVTHKSNLENDKETIIKDYVENRVPLAHLKKKYHYDSTQLRRLLVRNNVNIRGKSECNTRYNYDKTFFKKIDTDEKAYWLGFIYADGNVRKTENRYGLLQIALAEKDKNHLELFLKSIKSNHKLYRETKEGGQIAYRITIHTNDIYNDLKKLGLDERKSLTLKFPNKKALPSRLRAAFIRGYFDGDGSMSVNCEKSRWNFSIISTRSFLKTVRREVVKNTGFNKTKLTLEKRKAQQKLYYYNLGGGFKNSKERTRNLYNYLYRDASVFMARKRDKFLLVLNS